MAPSSNPVFLRMNTKLERARQELDNLVRSLSLEDSLPPGHRDDWGRKTKIAAATHNIYNGMEDVMNDVARYVDESVPTGESSHQDLLDQMSAPLEGKRPALIDVETFDGMVDLKNFRHFVRHKYGFNVDLEKSEEKFRTVTALLDRFEKGLASLQEALEADDEEDHTPQPK